MATLNLEVDIFTYDIDFNNHVSNITYIRWMEQGRLKLMEAIGMAVHDIGEQGFAPVLTRTEIAYRHPLYLGDKVRMEVFLTRLRKVSGTIGFGFYRDDELVAEGEQDGLFVSLDTQKVYRLSEEQLQRFTQYLIDT